MKLEKIVLIRRKLKMFFWFVIGTCIGGLSVMAYTEINNFLNADELGYLCKRGVTFIQADATSTVYIKSDKEQECVDEREMKYDR